MSESFIRRWANKKAEATQPEVVASEPQAMALPVQTSPEPARNEVESVPPTSPTLPSLEEAKLLTNQSDFIPFMRQGVAPAARNTALKTLFTDPQFNVMDMMDVYVDDYSKPDPIPDALLRMLNQSIDLGLFAQTPEQEAQAQEHQDNLAQEHTPELDQPRPDQA